MTTVLLDSHVLRWWSAEPGRLSAAATKAVTEADELAVAAISWFELAGLAAHERIVVSVPIRSWLEGLAEQVRTIATTPAVAATAVALPSSFPGDQADRLIYSTAIEQGWSFVTKGARYGVTSTRSGSRSGDARRSWRGWWQMSPPSASGRSRWRERGRF